MTANPEPTDLENSTDHPRGHAKELELKLAESLARERRLAREVRDLTIRCAELEREVERHEALSRLSRSEEDLQTDQQRLRQIERERDEARTFVRAVLESRSWRTMEMLRKLIGRSWGSR